MFFFSFIHFSFYIHFCFIFLHLFPFLTFYFALIVCFQLVQQHCIILSVIPTALKILQEERQGRPKKKKFKSFYFVFAVVSLKFCGFS